MSAPLNPNQFLDPLYHGTVGELQGDTLRPGVRSGATSAGQDPWKFAGQSRNEVVSASDDEKKAWNFAAYARGQGPLHLPAERTRVHVVEPNEETRVGVENWASPVFDRAFKERWFRKPNDNGEYVAPSFKVKETLDIMPGHQGTFPQINWNEHQTSVFSEANHPNDPYETYSAKSKQRRLGKEMAADERESLAKDQGRLF